MLHDVTIVFGPQKSCEIPVLPILLWQNMPFGASPEQSLRQSGHPKALRRCHLRRRGARAGRRRSRGRRGLEMERDPRKMEGKIMKNKQKRFDIPSGNLT